MALRYKTPLKSELHVLCSRQSASDNLQTPVRLLPKSDTSQFSPYLYNANYATSPDAAPSIRIAPGLVALKPLVHFLKKRHLIRVPERFRILQPVERTKHLKSLIIGGLKHTLLRLSRSHSRPDKTAQSTFTSLLVSKPQLIRLGVKMQIGFKDQALILELAII